MTSREWQSVDSTGSHERRKVRWSIGSESRNSVPTPFALLHQQQQQQGESPMNPGLRKSSVESRDEDGWEGSASGRDSPRQSVDEGWEGAQVPVTKRRQHRIQSEHASSQNGWEGETNREGWEGSSDEAESGHQTELRPAPRLPKQKAIPHHKAKKAPLLATGVSVYACRWLESSQAYDEPVLAHACLSQIPGFFILVDAEVN